MATHAHSTTAPARPLLPLVPFVFRPSPPVVDPRNAEEILREIAEEIERQVQGDTVTVAPSEQRHPCNADAFAQGRAMTAPPSRPEMPPEPLLQAEREARTLHLRRELCQALDHGFAMLDAIGLGPAALDQVDRAIRFMDEADGDPEAEPSLGWTSTAAGVVFLGDASDREDDTEEDEGTSLETAGRGFVRAGDDDAEDDDADEESDEPEGDGGEPYLSVVEWNGDGDNWGRTGHATSGWGTDVEDVNEDGDEARGAEVNDLWWFARSGDTRVQRTEAAHG